MDKYKKNEKKNVNVNSSSCITHMIKHSTFQKGKAKEGEEFWVQILVGTFFYIITKMFSYKKNININKA